MIKRRLSLHAVTSVLFFAPYLLYTGAAHAQTPVVLQAVTAATGACPSIPATQTTFQPFASSVWFDFAYTGGNIGDQFQIQWYEPNGTLYFTAKYTQTYNGGGSCYQYNISILGATAAGLPGTWTVNLTWNGTTIYSTKFTITAQTPLTDNFTQDFSLNSTLWSTATPLLKARAASIPATLEVPSLSFSGAGMTMTGVSGTGQYTGIQSNQSFTPPFTVQANVTGIVANGNAFQLELYSSDLSQYLNVSGNINSKNTGFYGVNLNYTGRNTAQLYATPSTGVLYTITVTVDDTGTAKVVLSNASGTVLGTQTGLTIGTGPLYLLLAQFEGSPVTVGPNSAVWQQVQVNPPSAHPAFFTGEVSLGEGVYYLKFPDNNLFGYYNYVASSILYHYDMGYEAFVPGSASDVYLYDFTSGHWFYTTSTLFPDLYDFTLNTWIYYFPNTQNPGHYTNPRYFSNLTSGLIFTM